MSFNKQIFSKVLKRAKAKLSPTVPTNNPTKGLPVSKVKGQNINPSARKPLKQGKRIAPNPVMKVSLKRKKSKTVKAKPYNFKAMEKKLGVIHSGGY
jgi:hypothetical protein